MERLRYVYIRKVKVVYKMSFVKMEIWSAGDVWRDENMEKWRCLERRSNAYKEINGWMERYYNCEMERFKYEDFENYGKMEK